MAVTAKNRQLYRWAVDLFVSVLSAVRKRKVRYQCNDADTQAWNNFIDANKVNEDLVRNIIQFGVQSYVNESMSDRQKANIRFAWMFGVRALKRYFDNGTTINQLIVRNDLKRKYRINTIRRESKLGELLTQLRPSEEAFKAEFHNSKRGLSWCIANTTLYHHRSPLCTTCNEKEVCKEMLKQNYNRVYILRGYVE